MRRNLISRVVFQSSVGAELRQGAGFIDGLARIEQLLDAARDETGAALEKEIDSLLKEPS